MSEQESVASLYAGMVLVAAAVLMAVGVTALLLAWVFFPGLGQVAVTHGESSLRGEGFYFLLLIDVGLLTMLKLMLSR